MDTFAVGHGQSEGTHNHVDDFSEYTSVIYQHCNEVKDKHQGLQLFIFGHSMVHLQFLIDRFI